MLCASRNLGAREVRRLGEHREELYGAYPHSAGPTIAKYGGELVAFDVAAATVDSRAATGSSPR